MKLSDYVFETLATHGVRHVFSVPGGAAMHLDDSAGRRSDMEFISNIHEQCSSIAAESYAKVTEGLGVCLVTAGPGGTNAITGLTGAWLDSTPCVFLSGQVKTADLKADSGVRQFGNQEIDIVTIVSSITKYAVTVTDPDTVRYHLEKALYLASSGRKGPVWLDIPLDVQAASINPDALQGFSPEPASPSNTDLHAAVSRTLDLLCKSERPLVLGGNGIRCAGAVEAFRELVDLLGIPVTTTWLAVDLIHDTHPLFSGRPGGMAPRGANFTLQNSDFLLSIGARLDMATVGYSHERFARGAHKVIVDLDEAEIRKLKMPIDEPVVADAGEFITELLRQARARRQPKRRAWIDQVHAWREQYPLSAPQLKEGQKGISTYDFSAILSDESPQGALLVPGSSGFASEIYYLMLKVKPGQRCFHNRGTGSMGFAIPSALGACIAGQNQLTISVDGDGGFLFNIQELATIARLNLPIKFFVVNNQGYASIRASQTGYFGGKLVGCDATSGLCLPDVKEVAKAFGIASRSISPKDDMRQIIREALAAPGPVVCEVNVMPDEPREPRLVSTRLDDGSIVSSPLEDLFPFMDRDEFARNMIGATSTK